MFGKSALRRIFGPKRDYIIGFWRKIHNEELHNLYSSPNIIRMIKSRKIRWSGNVECVGKKKNAYRLPVGKALLDHGSPAPGEYK
jgi:hypothetical protein